ncbi:hypothetical protein HJG60_008809 [Phyllostomus discolor]|uniref:Uncharacterized protein n=1 Tax=Phyllostomus discolor TaxID=89673 RepID=A0A834DFX4_9CHIR|nr:hypothetical protein HJG60_008809 [Phyllostomus discolor]
MGLSRPAQRAAWGPSLRVSGLRVARPQPSGTEFRCPLQRASTPLLLPGTSWGEGHLVSTSVPLISAGRGRASCLSAPWNDQQPQVDFFFMSSYPTRFAFSWRTGDVPPCHLAVTPCSGSVPVGREN